MLADVLTFLTLLNPFALFIYLIPLQKELEWRDYVITIFKASLIAGFIFLMAAFFGQAFFEKVLKLNFEAFRIFGGVVLVLFAATFIVQGRKSFITLKGSLDELAGEIALPFMVGAGTISLSILVGSKHSAATAFLTLGLAMTANVAIILILAYLRKNAHKVHIKRRQLYNSEILLRINGFILGAFGVEMVLRGVSEFLQSTFL